VSLDTAHVDVCMRFRPAPPAHIEPLESSAVMNSSRIHGFARIRAEKSQPPSAGPLQLHFSSEQS